MDELKISYQPESIRPQPMTTDIHGIRLHPSNALPPGVLMVAEEAGYVLVHEGEITRVTFDEVRAAWEALGPSDVR